MTRLVAGTNDRVAAGRRGARRPWLVVSGAVLAAACVVITTLAIFGTGHDRGTVTPVRAGTSVTVDVYFVTTQGRLASEPVTVESSGDRGVDAVTALIYTEPTDPTYRNAWSSMAHEANDTADAGARVLRVTESDGVITVDLDSHVAEGPTLVDCVRPGACPPEPSGELKLQQLVHTVDVALDSTDPVVLTDKGERATMVSGTPIDGPVEADPYVLADESDRTEATTARAVTGEEGALPVRQLEHEFGYILTPPSGQEVAITRTEAVAAAYRFGLTRDTPLRAAAVRSIYASQILDHADMWVLAFDVMVPKWGYAPPPGFNKPNPAVPGTAVVFVNPETGVVHSMLEW